MSEETRKKALLYNGWLFGLSMLAVAIFLLILKYHRLPYGGQEIVFTYSYADYASVIFLGGIGMFVLIKLYEYGIENNDERWPLLREVRAECIALKYSIEALKEDNNHLNRRLNVIEDACPKIAETEGEALKKILGKGGGRCG